MRPSKRKLKDVTDARRGHPGRETKTEARTAERILHIALRVASSAATAYLS